MDDCISFYANPGDYGRQDLGRQISIEGQPMVIIHITDTEGEPSKITAIHGEYEDGMLVDKRTCEQRGEHEWQSFTSLYDTNYRQRCRRCGEWRTLGRVNEADRAAAMAQCERLRSALAAMGD